ncbi:cell division protein ZapA [Phaeospirillum tilakii]|uniref:Cell division protein ZapA n=1 Tax=Phaeospirillum tilakii TaxID=741673 RepID=A0ABW5CB91_9PROT
MAVVTVTINGRLYDIGCDDSQAARVQALGRDIDSRAQNLLTSVGVVSDSRLLVMLCLMLADELADAREGAPAPARVAAIGDDIDARLASAIEALTNRLTAVADTLEQD